LDRPRNQNQIFVIRVRSEPREIQGAPLVWRVEIEHLNTSKKIFIKDLKEFVLFIQPILEEMGLQTAGPLRKSGQSEEGPIELITHPTTETGLMFE